MRSGIFVSGRSEDGGLSCFYSIFGYKKLNNFNAVSAAGRGGRGAAEVIGTGGSY
jgi:hypothetical protein